MKPSMLQGIGVAKMMTREFLFYLRTHFVLELDSFFNSF